MFLSGYYAWNLQEMIPQSLVHSFGKGCPPRADVKNVVKEAIIAPNFGTSETTDTTVRVTNFGAINYRRLYLLLRFIQTNDLETLQLNISTAYVFSLAQSFRGYVFDSVRGTFFIKITATANRSEAHEGDPSAILLVLDEAASVVLLAGRHLLQVLRVLQHNLDCTQAPLPVWYFTRQVGRSIAKKRRSSRVYLQIR